MLMSSPREPGAFKRAMRPLFRSAGPLYFYTLVACILLSAALSAFLGSEVPSSALPLPFYVVGFAGLHLLIAAFFMGARDAEGGTPAFGTVSFLWLFLGMYLIVASAIYIRIELVYPGLPSLPDWLVLGLRVSPFVLLFEVGWGTFFGMRYGLLGAETSAHPLGWLFRRTSPGIGGQEGDEGKDDDDE